MRRVRGAHHGAASGVGGAQHGASAPWSKVLDLSVNYQGREAKPPLSEANLTEQLEVGILCDLRLLEDGVFHCVRVWE